MLGLANRKTAYFGAELFSLIFVLIDIILIVEGLTRKQDCEGATIRSKTNYIFFHFNLWCAVKPVIERRVAGIGSTRRDVRSSFIEFCRCRRWRQQITLLNPR